MHVLWLLALQYKGGNKIEYYLPNVEVMTFGRATVLRGVRTMVRGGVSEG